ncbi:MAG: hypothetical protein Q4P18_01910 [Methanobrevibacter sp.]|uniref:hypothetical protein n=1 Tax=Methanobrevibacter sp. TaxID=66852 RepID=UPI0026E01321|nr:hypothetical protein [Methanobrevibacter sp.]MDO5848266.1 hypothetical protein [Methanobrevibacter sp.]
METVITIKIKNIESFYNPFVGDFAKNKSLNPDLEAYLKECLKAYTLEDIDKVRIHLQIENCKSREKITLENDLKKYFVKKHMDLMKNYQHLNKVRRKELAYGISIILICMLFNNVLDRIVPNYRITDPINTMIIIVGWVALWVPAVYFLYTKKDLKRQVDFMEAVSKLPIEYEVIKFKD